MSLSQQIEALATRNGIEDKAIKALIGNLANLNTTDKSNLVNAINEVLADAGVQIDDSSINSTDAWSSSKIDAELTSRINALIGNAPELLNTLNELAVAIQGNEGDITAIMTSLAGRLRIDVNNQGLTAAQRLNGQTNLDVYSKAEIGDVTTDFVAVYETALNS